MSHAVMGWAINAQTSPTRKAVLLALAYRADETGRCWPSLSRLGIDTCLSQRAIRSAIGGLALDGLIYREERSGTSTVYTLLVSDIGTQDMMDPGISRLPPRQETAPRHDVPIPPAYPASLPGMTCLPPRQDVPPTPAPPAPKEEESKIQRGKNPSGSATPPPAVLPAVPDLLGDVHAPTARQTMWRDGPNIIRQLIGCSDGGARKLLGRMLAEAKDDCIRVVQVLHEGQSLHPLADGQAWLLAAARGKQRFAPASIDKTAWADDLAAELTGRGPRPPEYDFDLRAEAAQ